jgi:hypothetical protein
MLRAFHLVDIWKVGIRQVRHDHAHFAADGVIVVCFWFAPTAIKEHTRSRQSPAGVDII